MWCMTPTCSVAECHDSVLARGLCAKHYARQRRTGSTELVRHHTRVSTCKVEGCERQAVARGLCNAHHKKWRKYGDALGGRDHAPRGPACSVDACEREVLARGWCALHYDRWRRTGDHLYEPVYVREEGARGGTWDTGDGYRRTYWPEHPNADRQGYVAEHVIVMAEQIGRPLERNETVHHRNGIRDDNHPGNLELWAKVHPAGQRVTDLLAFAHSIIDTYGAEESRLRALDMLAESRN